MAEQHNANALPTVPGAAAYAPVLDISSSAAVKPNFFMAISIFPFKNLEQISSMNLSSHELARRLP